MQLGFIGVASIDGLVKKLQLKLFCVDASSVRKVSLLNSE
jgi:hypothetical protein